MTKYKMKFALDNIIDFSTPTQLYNSLMVLLTLVPHTLIHWFKLAYFSSADIMKSLGRFIGILIEIYQHCQPQNNLGLYGTGLLDVARHSVIVALSSTQGYLIKPNLISYGAFDINIGDFEGSTWVSITYTFG